MGFPDRLLVPTERVLVDVRPHGVSFTMPVAWLVGFGVATYLSGVTFDFPTALTRILALVAISGACVIATIGAIRWETRAFVLTTHRVLSRGGLIGRKYRELPISCIAEVEFRQSLIQRRLDAGRIVVYPTQGDFPTIRSRVRDADHIHELLCQHVLATSQAAGRPDATSSPPRDEVLDPSQLLQRLAAFRDRGIVSDDEFAAKKADLLRRM